MYTTLYDQCAYIYFWIKKDNSCLTNQYKERSENVKTGGASVCR